MSHFELITLYTDHISLFLTGITVVSTILFSRNFSYFFLVAIALAVLFVFLRRREVWNRRPYPGPSS
jgi:hypothetical protein